jgi:4-aminobutyrate aminotransferase/(S)-3-amino-2-methylpropionate transaminase
MVRQKTGKPDMASLENAYHGLSLGVLQGCSAKKYRDTAGCELPDNFTRLPTAYCYRCEFQNNCKVQCLDGVDAQLAAKPNTAALIAEPVQAVGGVIPPESWWSRLDTIRKKHKLLLILDEIQTGVGRTGTMFAAEHYGLEPDIITAGKGLSGGVGSLAAVIASDEVIDGFFGGTTPTSAGNAVSAAAGLALIGVLEEEKLVENAKNMGEYFTGAVAELGDPWVGDIRFKGLLGGVELVSDLESKAILSKELVGTVKDALFEEGMLITVSGLHGNVLRLQPPLCITSTQLDTFVAILKDVLKRVRDNAA